MRHVVLDLMGLSHGTGLLAYASKAVPWLKQISWWPREQELLLLNGWQLLRILDLRLLIVLRFGLVLVRWLRTWIRRLRYLISLIIWLIGLLRWLIIWLLIRLLWLLIWPLPHWRHIHVFLIWTPLCNSLS